MSVHPLSRLRCFDCGSAATIAIEPGHAATDTLERNARGWCLGCWAQRFGGPIHQQEEAHG